MSLPVDPVALHLARRELALEKKQKQLERDFAIAFFNPHPKQRSFFANAMFHYRYARTGNRFGKSEMGAAEDVSFALGYRPWYPEGHPLRTLGIPSHATKGLIITTDWDKSKEVFTEMEGENLGKLIKYIPKKHFVAATRNHSGAVDRIIVRHVSGSNSVIHLDTVKSYKQNPLGQESSVWDWVHIDEPIPEGMWKAVSRGLVDRGGRAWFTCTPLTEPWIDKKFIPEVEDQLTEALPETSNFETSSWMMTGRMDDNPHLSPDAIQRFLQDLTEEEAEARRNGIPLSYSGLVYNEFSYATHVRKDPPRGWKSWSQPPADHCIYLGIDYHFKKPNAIPFIAVPPDGPAYVFHEIFSRMLLADEVAAINDVLQGRPYQPVMVDPLASTPNKVNDLTAMDEYRIAGLAVLPATKDPVNATRMVKALLKARDKDGGPCLIVNRECKRFIFEMARGYVMDEENNKPLKENDDMMEAFGRIVLQGLRYVEPSTDADYRPLPPQSIPSNVLDFNFGDSSTPSRPQRYTAAYRYRSGTERTHFEDEAVL